MKLVPRSYIERNAYRVMPDSELEKFQAEPYTPLQYKVLLDRVQRWEKGFRMSEDLCPYPYFLDIYNLYREIELLQSLTVVSTSTKKALILEVRREIAEWLEALKPEYAEEEKGLI